MIKIFFWNLVTSIYARKPPLNNNNASFDNKHQYLKYELHMEEAREKHEVNYKLLILRNKIVLLRVQGTPCEI